MDIHLHVPEGATPKDGPSAGIAIYTTLVSLMTKNPVKRTVAMTGEITLRGKVLPIGGLKEKLLAASRGGIKTVIIPDDNVKDLKDIPQNIKDKLEIVPVKTVEQVLDIALISKINAGTVESKGAA
jgi:ATP-dependent Lon protease